PETQAILSLLDDDLMPALLGSCVMGGFGWERVKSLKWSDEYAVNIVLAAKEYPGKVVTGHVVEGLAAAAACPGVIIYHAGTELKDGKVVTAGGRVLNVVGRGATPHLAQQRAYAAARLISWPGMQYRLDIGDLNWPEVKKAAL